MYENSSEETLYQHFFVLAEIACPQFDGKQAWVNPLSLLSTEWKSLTQMVPLFASTIPLESGMGFYFWATSLFRKPIRWLEKVFASGIFRLMEKAGLRLYVIAMRDAFSRGSL